MDINSRRVTLVLTVAMTIAWLALQCSMIAAAPVTFKVGLGGRPVSPLGVHLAGSFQGWDPIATVLEDADMDDIFEVTLEIPEGRYEFKFINGNTWEQAENVPESCSELDSSHFNRYISVADEAAEVHVCFSACLPCGELPKCKLFNCPAGFGLKLGMLDYPGSSQATCCDQLPSDLKAVVVRSAGWSDGNRAEFWMNGDLLYATGTRGLTVVELLPKSQTVILNQTFDTYLGSSELEAYLSSVAIGNLILMGAADEASTGFSSEAKALVEQCGGQLIQQISYRSSYALIGRKADSSTPPLAEVLLPSGSGQAVAAARVEVPETFLELPFCEMNVAAPPMAGTLAEDGNLQLDGCRYHVRENSDATECLQGSWVVVTGSSNALLMWNTLLMMLAPSEAGEQRYGRFGGANFLDAVIEDGVIVHYETVSSWLETCKQSTADGAVNETACRTTYAEVMAKAPAHSSKRIRLTMFLSFYWARTGTALKLIEADQPWAPAKVNLLVQVVAWYIVCNGIKCDCCHRPQLVDLPENQVAEMFQNEMAPVLDQLESFCAVGGRAGHGCAVATNSFTKAGARLDAMFGRFNALLTEALSSRKTASLRYVDIFSLGAAMPDETVNGHGTQILQLWTWQALLGGFCPVAKLESQVQFSGPLCWKSSVETVDECKRYSTYTGRDLWQCLNSQPCLLTAVPGPTPDTTTTTATTTTTQEAYRFEPVDGGLGRACRGDSAGDNSAKYFEVVTVTGLEHCRDQCLGRPDCLGIEHSGRRCELWTRRIGASIALGGFTCLRFVRKLPTSTSLTFTTTNMISHYFWPVDGGTHRACRGETPSDNLPGNYYVVGGIYRLADCQEACVQAQSCVGIEFSGGRCEVWTRPDGIQALAGFTCMRYSIESSAAHKRKLFLAPSNQAIYP